ncbi:MAG: tetratricopeptide repeat protein [Actinomycetota bacterium]|nr:tetratricopeptide repeat protein [Actinomycetota bacterium]
MFRNPRWRPAQRPQLVEHLVAASRGGAPQEEGWFFTGRRAVLERIVAWMHTEAPGAFVVTGSAGCGKSAVLGRIVALSEPTERAALLEHAPLEPADPDPRLGAIDAAVDLRGMGTLDLATALADRLRLPPPETSRELVATVAAMPYPPILVLDGLDEAIPEQADKIVTDLLTPLAVTASVLLATRHQMFPLGRPTTDEPGSVRLGELFGPATPVVDLDAEAGTAADIERYLASRLRSAGRADLVARMAPMLAERAAAEQGGFLYARLVVAQVLRQVVDVGAERWEQQLPTTITGALEHDLAHGVGLVRDGVKLPGAARDLLRALAWGLGRGIPEGMWEATATALSPDGVAYRAADLDWVLEHYGHYIVEDGQDGEALYRLSHQEFVEHLVESSPAVAGHPAAQVLADTLVTLARAQRADEPDRCSRYLRRHLARHATMAGAPGVAALHRLAVANPEAYLPDLATSLHNLASRLIERGQHEAAVVHAQDAADTYRALADADFEGYVAELAMSLNNVALYLSAIGRHQDALEPAAEAVDTFRFLAEAYPEVYFADLVTSLKNFADTLAVFDRISDAVDLYTMCVDAFLASPAFRDALIIERAGFHVSHGDAPTGLRELVTLLTSEDTGTPDTITLAARNTLRAYRARDAITVHRAWREVRGTEPPNWLALTTEQIRIVVEWVVAPNWAASKDFFAAHVEELLAPPTPIALEELQLLVSPRADQHQQLLDDIRERGVDAAYRSLLRPTPT